MSRSCRNGRRSLQRDDCRGAMQHHQRRFVVTDNWRVLVRRSASCANTRRNIRRRASPVFCLGTPDAACRCRAPATAWTGAFGRVTRWPMLATCCICRELCYGRGGRCRTRTRRWGYSLSWNGCDPLESAHATVPSWTWSPGDLCPGENTPPTGVPVRYQGLRVRTVSARRVRSGSLGCSSRLLLNFDQRRLELRVGGVVKVRYVMPANRTFCQPA